MLGDPWARHTNTPVSRLAAAAFRRAGLESMMGLSGERGNIEIYEWNEMNFKLICHFQKEEGIEKIDEDTYALLANKFLLWFLCRVIHLRKHKISCRHPGL